MTFPSDGVKKPHQAVIWVAAAWAIVGGVGLILLSIRQSRLYLDYLSEESDGK